MCRFCETQLWRRWLEYFNQWCGCTPAYLLWSEWWKNMKHSPFLLVVIQQQEKIGQHSELMPRIIVVKVKLWVWCSSHNDDWETLWLYVDPPWKKLKSAEVCKTGKIQILERHCHTHRRKHTNTYIVRADTKSTTRNTTRHKVCKKDPYNSLLLIYNQ